MARLIITKTPKVYVGGAFIRSESGRTFPLKDSRGALRRARAAVHPQGSPQRRGGRRDARAQAGPDAPPSIAARSSIASPR
jgi:hypothetical protein